MPQLETLRMSFSVLDGEEPRHWRIWSLSFEDLEALTSTIQERVRPYPVMSELHLLEETAEQLYARDSWASVVGALIHVTEDVTETQRLRAIHKNICHYLKREPDALCRKVGYYVLAVADPKIADEILDRVVDFVDDAGTVLGQDIPQFLPEVRSAIELKATLKFLAKTTIHKHEKALDR